MKLSRVEIKSTTVSLSLTYAGDDPSRGEWAYVQTFEHLEFSNEQEAWVFYNELQAVFKKAKNARRELSL